ncbi:MULTISPECIES: AvrE-family type 3 secretion system effector [unclassified Brenneria]|uniref:AvrE-family type 3 secretion system effector n=1 Tax=unclassified Brenneria TaxID=2634434 RepID=UPI0015563AF7|nr:AvrE-family type 3 secretion system effector [Brenneria sp. hezel4-2-4]MEE3649185.1 AvrE-family type 3 secretion system effector [Brenneria sp. HEZEL_4_2_4]NPC99140.1 AvrE-family type 3 secretion system effector [Brenneria sp. hezel4-2-4]
MQKIQHVQSSRPISEIEPASSSQSTLAQGKSSNASQKGSPSLIQQGLHDKNKPPVLEQGSGSQVRHQGARPTDLRSSLSSGGLIQGLPRSLRDSLSSGGPIQSLARRESSPGSLSPGGGGRLTGSERGHSERFFTPPSSLPASPRHSNADSDSHGSQRFYTAPSSPAGSPPREVGRRVFEQGESSHQTPISGATSQPSSAIAPSRSSLGSGGPIRNLTRFAPPEEFKVKIDDHGKIQFGKGLPNTLATLLQQTLGKNSQPFIAHHESQDAQQHALLDKSGRVFVIQREGENAIALHSSGRSPIPGVGRAGSAPSGSVQLTLTPGQIKLQSSSAGARGEEVSIPLSGKMNHELLTGIYRQPASASAPGEQLRIHDKKLFALSPDFGVWQQTSEVPHSLLSRQGDGQLYAVEDKHTLNNLSSGAGASKFSDEISDFSANKNGQLAVLTKRDHLTQLHLLSALDASPQPVDLLNDGKPVQAQSVALTAEHLLIADHEGNLFHAPLPGKDEKSVTLTSYDTPELDATLGANRRITGFAHDEHGQTHALATDRQGQKHVASLGQNGLSPEPGWNLSDRLVVDDALGLKAQAPVGLDTIDLGRLGKLALQDGKVHFYDKNSQSWEASSVEAGQLKRGLDNQAYILKDSKITPLSIGQKSDEFMHGDNTVFALSQVRQMPTDGTALPGISKEDNVSVIAMINRNKFVAVNQQGDLHFHQHKPGLDQVAIPPLALPKNGLSGEIRDITLDKQQNLFALNKEGQLFQLPKADWQNAAHHGAAQWRPVGTPIDGKINAIGTDAQHHLQIAHDEHQLYTRQSDEWKSEVPKGQATPSDDARAAETVFGTLRRATKGKRLPATGVTAKADLQIMGKTGAESQKVKSKLSDLVRAHIFNTSLDIPRPIKTFANHVQHQLVGREGLKPIYEMQTALLKKLEANTGQPQEPMMDLASKMEKLDLGEQGKPLVDLLKQFRTELETSSARAALNIGKHLGVVDANGAINTQSKPALPDEQSNAVSLSRQEKDLAPMLLAAMETTPASKESMARTLVKQFVDNQMPIQQKLNSATLGQQRDTHDALSLAKTRLVLDTLTLGDLYQLTDRLGTLSGTSPGKEALASLTTELNALRQDTYGANPVKKLTDMGFANHKALEADYDSIKTFMKAFRKEENAVSVTSRTVMRAGSQTDMIDKMKATLLSLDSSESIAFSRTYGGGASLAFVVLGTPLPFPPVPGGSVSGERTYNLSFARGDNGVSVTFERSGGITGKLSYSGGYDVSEYLTGTTSAEMTQEINDKHSFVPDIRASASISASLQVAQQNAMKFSLTEEELPGFIEGLTKGTLNPLALMDKGEQHSVKSGRTVSFNLDGSAALEIRGGIDLTTKGAKPSTVTLRGTAGMTASANVLSANSAKSVEQSENSDSYTVSDNRMQFMNQIALGANAGINGGIARTTDDGSGLVPIFAAASVGVNVAVDSRTNQSISLNMKKAVPMQKTDIASMTQSLAAAFTDPASNLVLDNVKKMTKPDDQLAILSEHFADKTAKTDMQHQVLTQLKRLDLRQDAAMRDGATLDSVKHSTSYTNLSKLTENGLFQVLGSHLFSTLPPSNADRVNQMIAQNPALKDIVSRLQDKDNATVTVGLELKDDVRAKVEQGIQNKTQGKDDVIALFKDKSNLRLASIEVMQTVKKSEGFTTPAVIINAASSAAVTMSKLLGSVSFTYGQDQTIPQSYTLGGEIAKAHPSTASAIQQLQQTGLQLKS